MLLKPFKLFPAPCQERAFSLVTDLESGLDSFHQLTRRLWIVLLRAATGQSIAGKSIAIVIQQ